jgi:seryl-tRNA(Sec) selenium transferase
VTGAGGGELAGLLTAEAAAVYRSLAGAVTVVAAALVAGTDPAAARRLPDAGGRPDGVVLPLAQAVELEDGLALTQLLRLGGAAPRLVGTAGRCEPDEVAAELARDGGVAGLHVRGGVGEAAVIGMAAFIWACRTAGRPALVLDLTGEGPLAALDAGADLVLLDPATAFAAPSAGLVAGRASLLAACETQRRGLGAMFQAEPALVAGVTEKVRAAAAASLAGGKAVPVHGASFVS